MEIYTTLFIEKLEGRGRKGGGAHGVIF